MHPWPRWWQRPRARLPSLLNQASGRPFTSVVRYCAVDKKLLPAADAAKGLRSVLDTLADLCIDAPKAPQHVRPRPPTHSWAVDLVPLRKG